LDTLVRLQFKAQGFSFLPRQPIQRVLYGRHASRLRGLNCEEIRAFGSFSGCVLAPQSIIS
jgi:hypothetical protein